MPELPVYCGIKLLTRVLSLRNAFVVLCFFVLLGWINLVHAERTEVVEPELVSMDAATPNHVPPQTFILRTIFGPDNSLQILSSQGDRVEMWALGSDSECSSLSVEYGNIQAGNFLKGGESVVVTCPLKLTLADLKRGSRKQFDTTDISAWPLASLPNGLCAWTQPDDNGNEVMLANVQSSFKSSIVLEPNQSAVDLDFSPNGENLAVALSRNVLDIYSVESALKPKLSLSLALPNPLPSFPDQMADLNAIHPRFIALNFGAANVVRFSQDSKFVAAANEVGINLFNLSQPDSPVLLCGHIGRISTLAFDGRGDLYSGGADKSVIMWKPGQTNGTEIARLSEIPARIDVRSDGEFIALGFPSGRLEVWNVEQRAKVLTILFFPSEAGWFAVTPQGLFDTSEGGWRHLGWRFPNDPTNSLPIESYFRDYYQPGLVPNVLAQAILPPVEPISLAKPVLPKISLAVVGTQGAKYDLTPAGFHFEPEKIDFRLEVWPLEDNTPLKDLQVSHNGVVVRKWPGPVTFTDGLCVKEFELQAFPWENRVAAAVYTENDLRSQESVWERPMQGYGYSVPPKTLHVVSIGVSKTLNSHFCLDWAAADAQSFSSAFSIPTNELQTMAKRVQDWNNSKSMRLMGAFKWEAMPDTIVVSTLTNEQATHDGILKLIRDTVANAEPADSFIFYFSGHGIAVNDSYFLVPSDAELPRQLTPEDQLPTGFDAGAAGLISDSELQEVLEPLDVSHAAIILDACNSGAALKGFEEGPLFDPKGLGRMVYEKGINLLAASTSGGVTSESPKLHHSYLNYALVEDGLLHQKADCSPHDGRIELREWLIYSANRAKELANSEGFDFPGTELAPRLVPERESLILWAGDKEPQQN